MRSVEKVYEFNSNIVVTVPWKYGRPVLIAELCLMGYAIMLLSNTPIFIAVALVVQAMFIAVWYIYCKRLGRSLSVVKHRMQVVFYDFTVGVNFGSGHYYKCNSKDLEFIEYDESKSRMSIQIDDTVYTFTVPLEYGRSIMDDANKIRGLSE